MTDRWTDQLSEYLDGDLAPAERTALEAHLVDCAACRNTVDELRRVVTHAHALEDRPMDHDLWGGIAARINGPIVPAIDPGTRRARRQLTLSLPQLAAAAVLLLAIGAGVTALTMHAPLPAPPRVRVATTPALHPIPAGLSGQVELNYDAAVRDLELALDSGRSQLSPRTVTVLERNLTLIDLAIEEARAALAADPANTYLSAHLASTMKQKLALLQQATELAHAAS